MGNRHENEPGELHDLDRGHRALTYTASVTAPSLSQAFPLVGCVMVHLFPVLLVFKQCESLADWMCIFDTMLSSSMLFLMKPYFQKLATSHIWMPEAGVGGPEEAEGG